MNFIFERRLTFYDVKVFFMVNNNMLEQFFIPNLSHQHMQVLNEGAKIQIPTYDSQQKKNYTFCLHNLDEVADFYTFREGWLQFKKDMDLTVNDNIKFYFTHNPYQLRVSITSPIQNFPKQKRSEKQKIYEGLTRDESIAVDALLLLSKKVVDFQENKDKGESKKAGGKACSKKESCCFEIKFNAVNFCQEFKKVLSLLGGELNGNALEKPTKVEKTVIEMPGLIDTGDNDLLGEDPTENQNEQVATKPPSSSLLIDDLFGDGTNRDLSKSELRTDDDPFAAVSFHTVKDKDQGNDLFAGMTVGENSSPVELPKSDKRDPFDFLGSSEPLQTQGNNLDDVNNLMVDLSISGNGSVTNKKASNSAASSESIFSVSNSNPGSVGLSDSLSSGFDPLKATTNANVMFPMGSIPYSIPPGIMYNQFYPAAPVNYGAMGRLLAPQQFMAAMANLQVLNGLNANNVAGGIAAGTLGGNVSPIPDIFNANMPAQTSTVTMNAPKEETKAFDFITAPETVDHLYMQCSYRTQCCNELERTLNIHLQPFSLEA